MRAVNFPAEKSGSLTKLSYAESGCEKEKSEKVKNESR